MNKNFNIIIHANCIIGLTTRRGTPSHPTLLTIITIIILLMDGGVTLVEPVYGNYLVPLHLSV